MTEEERLALLNTPAFGPGSEEPKQEEKQEVVVESEDKTTEEEGKVESEEESKVPYSRFKKFHDEATQLRTEVEELRKQMETYKPNIESKQEEEVPADWIELYGDSEASKRAWFKQQKLNEDVVDRARQEALEAVRNERYQEVERLEKNVTEIDEKFELLQDFVGRELTEKEQEAVLDIVDEYTPKDDSGNYAGSILPLDKAWGIYELKQQASNAPKKIARDNVASLSGNRTAGESDAQAEKDKAFNPFAWDSYKGRL